jgi:hypothetical protein
MASGRDRAERWKELAAEALAVANDLSDPEARQIMLAIAGAYERLARRAEERDSDNSDNGSGRTN